MAISQFLYCEYAKRAKSKVPSTRSKITWLLLHAYVVPGLSVNKAFRCHPTPSCHVLGAKLLRLTTILYAK